MERKCDLDNPCDDNLECNLSTNTCRQPIEEKGYIQAKIDGHYFTATIDVMRNLITTHVARQFDLKCHKGVDHATLEEFEGHFISEFEDVISFINTDNGIVLCESKPTLLNWWNNSRIFDERRIRYYNFPLFPHIVINGQDQRKIRQSSASIFIISPSNDSIQRGDDEPNLTVYHVFSTRREDEGKEHKEEQPIDEQNEDEDVDLERQDFGDQGEWEEEVRLDWEGQPMMHRIPENIPDEEDMYWRFVNFAQEWYRQNQNLVLPIAQIEEQLQPNAIEELFPNFDETVNDQELRDYYGRTLRLLFLEFLDEKLRGIEPRFQ